MAKRTEMQRLNESAPAEIRVRGEYAMASETDELRARAGKLEKTVRLYGALLLIACLAAAFLLLNTFLKWF
jgi:hypothetical protein